MSAPVPLRIAIVGYGTAGQALAILLGRGGHHVDVFEQSSELRAVGAGFLLQPIGMAALGQTGLLDEVLNCGARIERLFGTNAAGRVVMDMRYDDYRPDCFGLGLCRGTLFRILENARPESVRVHCGARIVGMHDRTLRDVQQIEHGPFDLIVAADGANSVMRALATSTARDSVYPWGAVWCLLPADGWLWPDSLQQRYAGAREMIGVLPVGAHPDHEADRRWLTFFYSLPGDEVARFDEAALARLRARVAALWPELKFLTDALQTSDQLNRARYRDVVLRRPFRDRLVVVGDAAHGMSPQLGQGVNLAMLDALALANAIASEKDIETALRDYARQRASHVAVYQHLSRWLTPLFQSEHDFLARCRDLAFAPLSRLPLLHGQMLKVLTGGKSGWLN
ncbi:MAG: NAD(P)/FAD-dependent oxidoreductase [Dokdonella sp.]